MDGYFLNRNGHSLIRVTFIHLSICTIINTFHILKWLSSIVDFSDIGIFCNNFIAFRLIHWLLVNWYFTPAQLLVPYLPDTQFKSRLYPVFNSIHKTKKIKLKNIMLISTVLAVVKPLILLLPGCLNQKRS